LDTKTVFDHVGFFFARGLTLVASPMVYSKESRDGTNTTMSTYFIAPRRAFAEEVVLIMRDWSDL
jgi:hypothetical protein